jgi:hypothetical protein
MKHKTPNLLLNEYSARGILDTLYAPKVQQSLFETVVDGIKLSVKTDKKEFVVCNIPQVELNVTIPKSSFVPALKSAIDFYLKVEDYHKCTQINNLIQELENGRRIKT